MDCCLIVCGSVVDLGLMYDRYLADVLWIICESCDDVVVGKCIVDMAGSLVDIGSVNCRCWVGLGFVYCGS